MSLRLRTFHRGQLLRKLIRGVVGPAGAAIGMRLGTQRSVARFNQQLVYHKQSFGFGHVFAHGKIAQWLISNIYTYIAGV